MSENINIRVLNYDLEGEKHDLEYQSLLKFTSTEEIVEFIKKIKIPEGKPPIHPTIVVTKDYYIKKVNENKFQYNLNRVWIKSYTFPKRNELDSEGLEKLLEETPQRINLQYKVQILFSGLLWIIFPLLNIFNIINRIILGVYEMNIISLFIVLLSVSFITVAVLFSEIVSKFTHPEKFDMEYEMPIIMSFGQLDLSDMFFLLSQFFYGVFYIAIDGIVPLNIDYLLSSLNDLLLIFGVIVGIPMILIALSSYNKLKTRKDYCLQFLYEKLNTERENAAKQYYFNLTNELKKKKIVTIGFLSKISAIISFILSVVPLFIDLVI